MYTYVLILRIKVCQLFRNYICGVTHNNPFGLWLTTVNEAAGIIHNKKYPMYSLPMYVCTLFNRKRSKTLPATALSFGICIRDTLTTVHWINISTRTQLYHQV